MIASSCAECASFFLQSAKLEPIWTCEFELIVAAYRAESAGKYAPHCVKIAVEKGEGKATAKSKTVGNGWAASCAAGLASLQRLHFFAYAN